MGNQRSEIENVSVQKRDTKEDHDECGDQIHHRLETQQEIGEIEENQGNSSRKSFEGASESDESTRCLVLHHQKEKVWPRNTRF